MAIDIGIDLGTASVIVYVKGKGVVLTEPTIVAIDTRTGKIITFGQKAHDMLGRTPLHIKAITPLHDGVISDYYITEEMIKYFVKKICGNRIVKPRLTICVPSGVTDVESKAVVEAASTANVRKVFLIEEPVAAAIGAGIDISKPIGRMIVDIGGGTTDAAVISLNGVVAKASVKIAGKKMDEALIRYIRNKHNVLLGDKTAEQLKINLGNMFDPNEEIVREAKGRNLVTGLPQIIEINEVETYEAFEEYAYSIALMIQSVIERTPPELVADIAEHGIVMTGGGALLKGLPKYLQYHLNVKTIVADNPIDCVAKGTGESFDYLTHLTDGFVVSASK